MVWKREPVPAPTMIVWTCPGVPAIWNSIGVIVDDLLLSAWRIAASSEPGPLPAVVVTRIGLLDMST